MKNNSILTNNTNKNISQAPLKNNSIISNNNINASKPPINNIINKVQSKNTYAVANNKNDNEDDGDYDNYGDDYEDDYEDDEEEENFKVSALLIL